MRLSSLLYIGISAIVVMACGEEEVKKAPKLKKAAKSLPKNAVNESISRYGIFEWTRSASKKQGTS
jgi:hypothetical protein